jgi:hypothetical protein
LKEFYRPDMAKSALGRILPARMGGAALLRADLFQKK